MHKKKQLHYQSTNQRIKEVSLTHIQLSKQWKVVSTNLLHTIL